MVGLCTKPRINVNDTKITTVNKIASNSSHIKCILSFGGASKGMNLHGKPTKSLIVSC